MTQDEIREWLLTLCPHCSIQERNVVECTCSLCRTKACSVHRGIFGETIVCEACHDRIDRGTLQISPELKQLMDESKARMRAFFSKNLGW